MSFVTKRIIAALIAMLASLTAVASTLPPEATLASIPMVSWMIAMSSGLAGFYAPRTVVKDDPETTEDLKQ